jgi:hypothetical protein
MNLERNKDGNNINNKKTTLWPYMLLFLSPILKL